MLGALVTVVLVLLLAYWFSRLLGRGLGRVSGNGNMRVMESLPLGADRQLVLVELQERVYLMGVSSAGIQLLTEVEGDLKRPESVSVNHTVSRFREILEKKRGENQ